MPIHCDRLAHRRIGDHLGAMEWTYGHEIVSGFEGNVRNPGAVGPVEGYRASINEPYAKYFWDSIKPPAAAWAYALHLIDGPRFRLASKVAARLGGRRQEIDALIRNQVDRSRQKFQGEMLAAGLPLFLVHPIIPLMAAAAKAVGNLIVEVLVKTFSETSLTTWTIWHTALTGSDSVPISIFTLAGPRQSSPGLCRLLAGSDGRPIADDDYEYDPVERRQARYMIGESTASAAAFDDGFFDLVATSGRPLAWQEPLETNGGFRILVPHGSAASRASYISAIRCDVHLMQGPIHKRFRL
jgi:hypothetical protein